MMKDLEPLEICAFDLIDSESVKVSVQLKLNIIINNNAIN